MQRLVFQDSITERAYKRFREQWLTCCRCPLSSDRTNVVLCRGTLPATLVFLGEAPGESEDARGWPFIGPAGSLLDELIVESMTRRTQCDYVITNMVCCLPRIFKMDGPSIRRPKKDEIEACNPRLKSFLRIASPKLVITLGGVARSAVLKAWDGKVTSLVHPSSILQESNERQALVKRQRFVTDLTATLEVLLNA